LKKKKKGKKGAGAEGGPASRGQLNAVCPTVAGGGCPRGSIGKEKGGEGDAQKSQTNGGESNLGGAIGMKWTVIPQ